MKPGWRIRRLTTGSAIVTKRTRKALVPHDADGEMRIIATLLRCGPLVAAAPRILDLAHQSPIWLAGGTCAWCIAAWKAKPEEPKAEPTEDDQAADEPGEPSPEALRAAVLARLLDWVGDRNGIPIAEVYERYRGVPGHEHLTDAQIRAALVEHYGLEVKPVRIGDKTPRGIHRDDLQPLPSPAVAEPVADDRNTPLTSTVAA